jgi:hypothetical protein
MSDDELTARDWLEKSYDKTSDWSKTADPKALGVVVLLSLGLKDLLDHGGVLVRAAGDHHGLSGAVATISFWLACGFAGLAVFCVISTLVPRIKASKQQDSLIFFSHIAATNDSGVEYLDKVRASTSADFELDLAKQTYEISRVAASKHKWARRSILWAIAFLVAWAVSRLGLVLEV